MIPSALHTFISIDLIPLAAACFAAISCALLGNYLVLRKQSLMGDTISHAVLPGIVLAFILSNSRTGLPVFIGAMLAAILTAILVESIKKLGKVESGAAMGVVFSVLFAIGILLMEQASSSSVDIDTDCLIYGQLELMFWIAPNSWSELLRFETLSQIPSQVFSSFSVAAITCAFVIFFYKELKITTFDPSLAGSLGFKPSTMHYLLMLVVAASVVASFEAVGSILVIAMLICPSATARLLTDKLRTQLILSVVIAVFSSLLGYFLASFIPSLMGLKSSFSAAGMMTVTSGGIFTASVLLAPQYGILSRAYRKLRLKINVRREDILGLLARIKESNSPSVITEELLTSAPKALLTRMAIKEALKNKELNVNNGVVSLTPEGSKLANKLVRSHRLWESFFVEHLGMRPDHVHDRAMELEHFTSDEMAMNLSKEQDHPIEDPHKKPIPKI